tara:strand:- start:3136 stop:3552 length:417 start_codon:yes stop_codon:yes gene_type:complete
MGGGSRTPKPPPIQTPPPPVEDISATYQSPTMRQEVARRQRRGAFATRGQTLGASGEVLGAGPTELAPIAQATGTDAPEKELTLEEFSEQNPVTVRTGMPQFRGQKKKKLQEKQYQDYLKKLRKQTASRTGATRGQTI